MEKYLDDGAWPALRGRLLALQADTPRVWGTMRPVEMIRHLRYLFDLSLGREPVRDVSLRGVRQLIYWCFFRWFTTWPGGKIKAPSYFTPPPGGTLEDERAQLLALVEAFLALAQHEPERRAVSPMLGPVRLEDWRYIHGAHCDHHLRQFGL